MIIIIVQTLEQENYAADLMSPSRQSKLHLSVRQSWIRRRRRSLDVEIYTSQVYEFFYIFSIIRKYLIMWVSISESHSGCSGGLTVVQKG